VSTCVFCLQEKDKLTDEHIIPAALGSNLVLSNASCEDCQTQCNRSFEQRFLKGSNFIAMIRAHLGIRGRRNEPVFGFDRHGHPLTVAVQPGFPPIRIGLAAQRLERPMQIILADEHRSPISYYFLPNEIKRPILPSLFDTIIDDIPKTAHFAAFWADGDSLAANPWRELLEAFVAWSNNKTLLPIASSIASGEARVDLTLDWNTEDRNRGLAKISYMYALSSLPEQHRYSPAFEDTRTYILNGTAYPHDYWRKAPVLQWNGTYPGINVIGEHKFTYMLALVSNQGCLFCLIRLHNMGLFAVKLTPAQDSGLGLNSLSTYLLNKEDNGRYSLQEHNFSQEKANDFAASAISCGQL